MADLPMQHLENDLISSVDSDESSDRVIPVDYSADDVLQFVEAVSGPRMVDKSGIEINSSEPVMSRMSSLALLLESQRNNVERTMAKASRTADPLVQDELAHELTEMSLNHEFALKLIGKLQASLETLTKMQ